MTIVVLGLSITSSWGNGHATTYRALVRALADRGHDVLFLERDVPWYADNRDLPHPPYCRTGLYDSLAALQRRHAADIARADLVVVGSYVPAGVEVADLVLQTAGGCTAFYDIDTPVTVAALEANGADYLEPRQIPAFDLYLSFTGGPILDRLGARFGARRPRPLYCSVDPDAYIPDARVARDLDLGYLGTYSADRQPALDRLLLGPATSWPEGRFVIAGPQYPDIITWPGNVQRIQHLAPGDHALFYNRLRFTLNVTRQDMVRSGYAPSVRLFEAAACGTPIVSDRWPGLEAFFAPEREILLADDGLAVLRLLRELPEAERQAIALRARARILGSHTAAHRAEELERYVREAAGERPIAPPRTAARFA